MTTPQPHRPPKTPNPVGDHPAAPPDAAETLTALDWHAYACQCDQHGTTGCPHPATHTVHIHAIDTCDRPEYGHHGNRIQLRCTECLHRLRTEIRQRLHRIAWARPACQTCGAPLTTVTDIIRAATPLPRRGRP